LNKSSSLENHNSGTLLSSSGSRTFVFITLSIFNGDKLHLSSTLLAWIESVVYDQYIDITYLSEENNLKYHLRKHSVK
ncbi:LOW QUALITY PROTEIN: hypothetical protein Smp_159820, partial [Schistosoma mansoni]|uniref:hypothetical protein n=1 Tax=Schistosoma mansoni TaxID=6183 RepID=UPI00022C8363